MAEVNAKVAINRVGWEALKHKDGWWLGNKEGVLCYGDHDLARAALTIAWQRDGGRHVNYRIETFTGADLNTGEYTPRKSAEQAIHDYEKAENFRERLNS